VIKRCRQEGICNFDILLKKEKLYNFIRKEQVNTDEECSDSSDRDSGEEKQELHFDYEKIKTSIERISDNATNQARDLELCYQKGLELSKNISDVIDKTTRLHSLSIRAGELKEQGIEIINHLIEKYQNAGHSFNLAVDAFSSVAASKQEIVLVSEFINNIAKKTKLLSLNAAIEAARAGEAGKGFAVVVEEIRKLADEVSKSTNNINKLVDSIQIQYENAKEVFEHAVMANDEQKIIVERTKQIFDRIHDILMEFFKEINNVKESGENMELKRNEIMSIIENIAFASLEWMRDVEQIRELVNEQAFD
jgi:methyl-accepting chemotaxis protein